MNYYVMNRKISPYEGLVVNKDTALKFENKNVKQEIKDLKLTTIAKEKNEQYESTTKITFFLKEGDILLFEKNERGYFLPAVPVQTIKSAMVAMIDTADTLDGCDPLVTLKKLEDKIKEIKARSAELVKEKSKEDKEQAKE